MFLICRLFSAGPLTQKCVTPILTIHFGKFGAK